MDLEVTEVGSGDTLVVFVHGVLGHGRSFDRVAAVLESECRMLWYDRRGYGGSQELPTRRSRSTVTSPICSACSTAGEPWSSVIPSAASPRWVPRHVRRESVAALVLYETSVAWVPGWDDGVMHEVLASEDPEGAGLRVMLGGRYETLSDDERARRRVDAGAFIAEEASVRTGTPPYAVSDIRRRSCTGGVTLR